MPSRATDLEPYVQQAVPNLIGYLQVDTINPPGNESRGVVYLSTLLDKAGIAHESIESAPGRGNLWAKLPATPDAEGKTLPALVLLHHIDVVPANAAHWSVGAEAGCPQGGMHALIHLQRGRARPIPARLAIRLWLWLHQNA